MSTGWIKIHRGLISWEWYDDINTSRLFIHCLIRANHSDANWRGTEIKRGSFLTSLETLSKETSLSVSQIRTSLKKLNSTNEITSLSQARSRVITVVNYDSYQASDKLPSKLVAGSSQADDKLVTTDKNVKNVENEKNVNKLLTIEWADEYLELFWSAYPKKVDKKKTFERLTKMIKQKPDQQHFGMILKQIEAKALVDDKQFWPSPDRYLREEKWTDEIITQGVTHGQHQQATQPKPSLLDRVKAGAEQRERERAARAGREFSGQGMDEANGDVRPQVCEPVRGDTGRHMGNLLEGDFSQTDS